MSFHSLTYWYREETTVANAFLYNCRDDDLYRDSKNQIMRGMIVVGKNGIAIAENVVPGLRPRESLPFVATRRCEWEGRELQCMVHSRIGQQALKIKELRHVGCVVAELPDAITVALANGLNVRVIHDSVGRKLINLSVERHAGQSKARRATLL